MRDGVIFHHRSWSSTTQSHKRGRGGIYVLIYHCCDHPDQLIVNTIFWIHLDGENEENSTCCAVQIKIIIVLGIDKSDNDLAGTQVYMYKHLDVWKVLCQSVMILR